MKTLLLGVSCVNEHVEDYPQTFMVNIDDKFRAKILKVQEYIKEIGASNIDFDFNDGLWSDEFYDGAPIEDFMKGLEENSRLECKTLVIANSYFWFTCIPKHCGDDMLLRTCSIYTSSLSDNSIYQDLW